MIDARQSDCRGPIPASGRYQPGQPYQVQPERKRLGDQEQDPPAGKGIGEFGAANSEVAGHRGLIRPACRSRYRASIGGKGSKIFGGHQSG